ncbi:MAG: hypothetical protein IPK99_17205 [Flavobacteriales bacterium]|nr:hypothetical protein [Flavobacteriales bacterium]
MTDRSIILLLERLRAIAARKSRFAYDVRGNSYVNSGMVAPYAPASASSDPTDLEGVLHHALQHDAVVSGYRDPADGKMRYTSCRLFTDVHNAVVFARAQRQPAVYNWNRLEEVAVEPMGTAKEPVGGSFV